MLIANMKYFKISQIGDLSFPREVEIDSASLIYKGNGIYCMEESSPNPENGDTYDHEIQVFVSEVAAWDEIFNKIDEHIEHQQKIRHILANRAALIGYIVKGTSYYFESGKNPSPNFKSC